MEMQNQCAEIKIRTERKAGELIPDQITTGGSGPKSHDATLKGLGIEHNQSVRWQSVAAIPEEAIEDHIKEVYEFKDELTTADFLIL